jgi:hypothetical protein
MRRQADDDPTAPQPATAQASEVGDAVAVKTGSDPRELSRVGPDLGTT